MEKIQISKAPWRVSYVAEQKLGVRNSGGFICFLTKPHHFTGQTQRFLEESREVVCNAATIAYSPEMLDFLQNMAYPKRGSEQEAWTIEQAAGEAQKILKAISDIIPD